MNDEFFTVNELAILLKVHWRTILNAIKKGRIHAFRVGPGLRSPYRIPRTEIERIQVMSFEEILKNLKDK